jgi:alpha,alpha-trehalase
MTDEQRADVFPAISDYALISDCHSLALIARDGSIEWAVFHRFDGRPPFARILDRSMGGHFRVGPGDPAATVSRRYLPDTNVLETTFDTAEGQVTLTDFMPIQAGSDDPGQARRPGTRHSLIRVLRGVRGRVEVQLEWRPRFSYGLTTPFTDLLADDLAISTGGADALLLQSELGPLASDDGSVVEARASIGAGDERVIVVSWSTPSRMDTSRLPRETALAQLDGTVAFWQEWSRMTTYAGPYREAVVRSALIVKGLTDERTGAYVAAATTSLPEEIGGERNWDYRYTWIRDSTTILAALVSLGHRYEARRFSEWLAHTTAGRASELQIMYGIGGERILTETELPHLSGYRGSRPVRIGNAAWDQTQLDTYGWLTTAFWYVATHVRELGEQVSPHMARFLRDVVEMAIERFDEVDEGIWEVRGRSQHFLHSKLMMWLAVDVGIKLVARSLGADEVPSHWPAACEAMRRRIETEGVDPVRGAFTQALGSPHLDAAALNVSLLGFLPGDDPRVLATIEAIDAELGVGGHIYRYRSDDGLAGDEGTFVFCTLWMVSALARSGQVARARERLEMVLSHANDVGLLAEEIDPRGGQQLGNFPQAFSHVGIITAALDIEAADGGEIRPVFDR